MQKDNLVSKFMAQAERVSNDTVLYSPKQALEAIKARISGEWDNAELMKLGPLLVNALDDIQRIVDATEQ